MSDFSSYIQTYGGQEDDLLRVLTHLRTSYGVRSLLYPGSWNHVSPVLAFPEVAMVDKSTGLQDFFNTAILQDFILTHKSYDEDHNLVFHESDFTTPLPLAAGTFDVLLSLGAGPVSRDCRLYLKPGGLLLVNDAWGDATNAQKDPSYELVEDDQHYRVNAGYMDLHEPLWVYRRRA